MQTHAAIPVADRVDDESLRIYFGTRDGSDRSRIGFVDVDPGDPANIRAVSDRPVLPLGDLGTFDESGIAPSWIVSHGGSRFLYYIGWSLQVTVPYRLAIGLAIGDGETFTKHSAGPIWDRTPEEPYFSTAPCVLIEDGVWRMWYVSCTGWETVDGRPEPRYRIAYAESADGIQWVRPGIVCIDFDDFAQAIGRPCVRKTDVGYTMYYSYRSIRDYRRDRSQSYRLGLAVSADGINWTRQDDAVGISRSETGWDSDMLEYSSLYAHRDETYMLYNGNGFGRTGFGYATLDRE